MTGWHRSGSTSTSGGFFLYLERSIERGTQWTVFEPNDEPLWRQVRQSVDGFLYGLWRDGAFQGQSPRDAYS